MAKTCYLFLALAPAISLLAACASSQQSSQSGFAIVPPALAKVSGLNSIVPERSCPKKYFACVVVGYGSPASIKLCVGSACSGGSGYPLIWGSEFTTRSGMTFKGLAASFDPNPGNPTKDTISEKKRLKPSNGRIRYEQYAQACTQTPSPPCEVWTIGVVTE